MTTAVDRARAGLASPSSLHVDLNGRSLAEFIDTLSAVAYKAYPDGPRNIAAYRAVRAAIIEELRKVLVAYDTCGLSSMCTQGEASDPWASLQDG